MVYIYSERDGAALGGTQRPQDGGGVALGRQGCHERPRWHWEDTAGLGHWLQADRGLGNLKGK